jgi:hypothetical protein
MKGQVTIWKKSEPPWDALILPRAKEEYTRISKESRQEHVSGSHRLSGKEGRTIQDTERH